MSRIGDALKRAGASEHGRLRGAELTLDRVRFQAPGGALSAVDEAEDSTRRRRASARAAGAVRRRAGSRRVARCRPSSAQSEKLVANSAVAAGGRGAVPRLAAILHHAQKERGIRRVLVASALAEEGKTLTATNLALTLSESYRKRVLLIDADLRRPGVNIAFGIAKQAGLSEALAAGSTREALDRPVVADAVRAASRSPEPGPDARPDFSRGWRRFSTRRRRCSTG